MDGSGNPGVNTSHLPRQDSINNGFNMDNAFLGGIQNYADSSEVNTGNDISDFLHPELFEPADTGSNVSQQAQPSFHSAFNPQASRQSQSPALPQYNPPQQSYSSQSPYPQQPMFDSRTMYQPQPTFDPRLFQPQRSSQSPAPLDQFSYQNPSFNQNYLHQQTQQRQSSTPTQQYSAPSQQAYTPFGQWDSRNSSSFNQFQGFEDQPQQASHSFVDPSIFPGSQLQPANANYPSLAPRQQQYQPPSYFSKPGSGVTIDPRALQGQQQFLYDQQIQQRQAPAQNGMMSSMQNPAAVKKKAPKDPNAPKRPRGRPRKDGQPPKQTGDQSSDSDSDLSFENDPEMRPAIISVSMPTDPRGQLLYKAVVAVWTDRNNHAPVEKVRSGIADFGNAVKAFRDLWKEKNEKLKKAELDGSAIASQAPMLKKEVTDDRQFMVVMMERALNLGHPDIIKRLGENQWVMSALYSFMLDRVTATDLESSLVSSILKLVANFDTIDEAQLETYKWLKLLQRLTKKAGDESKTLAQKILTRAAALTAKNKAEGERQSPKPNGGAGSVALKRAREGEGAQPAPKKPLLKASSKPLALQNAERRRAIEKEEATKKAKAAKEAAGVVNGAASSTAAKPKVVVPPKTTSFGSLMSASKKPGTSNAERAAAAKDSVPFLQPIKKDPGKRDSPPRLTASAPRSQSSFMHVLNDFDKKKEIKSEKKDEPLNETPEEKTKRLRKELRSKLRVKWKSDSELVDIREFTHDPDEEIGPEDNMMKDAGDTMSEGETLKRKRASADLEDEEDDDEMPEDEYSPPSEVDFSVIPELDSNIDLGTHGIKYGGTLLPESPSREAQTKLEASTIMVVYDGKSDRPLTPTEPPEEGDDDNFSPCLDFGEPDDRIRNMEKQLAARRQPPSTALGGLDISALVQRATHSPAQAWSTSQSDIQSILSKLQPNAHPQPPTSTFDLKTLVANVHNAQQYPQHVQMPTQTPQTADLSAILAAYQNSTNQQLGKHALEDPEDSEKKKSKYPANYKTLVCTFWKEGRCTKGDNCTYKHAE